MRVLAIVPLLLVVACGQSDTELPEPDARVDGMLPLEELAAETPEISKAERPPISKEEALKRHRKRLRDKRRRERPQKPLRHWGIMDMISYRTCVVGDRGLVQLTGNTVGPPALGADALATSPMTTPVPGDGRHAKNKGVALHDLYPEGIDLQITECSGTKTVVEAGEKWWLVRSTRGFVKGIRIDTRPDLIRDITAVGPVPAEGE